MKLLTREKKKKGQAYIRNISETNNTFESNLRSHSPLPPLPTYISSLFPDDLAFKVKKAPDQQVSLNRIFSYRKSWFLNFQINGKFKITFLFFLGETLLDPQKIIISF